jgi:hypothetical protein
METFDPRKRAWGSRRNLVLPPLLVLELEIHVVGGIQHPWTTNIWRASTTGRLDGRQDGWKSVRPICPHATHQCCSAARQRGMSHWFCAALYSLWRSVLFTVLVLYSSFFWWWIKYNHAIKKWNIGEKMAGFQFSCLYAAMCLRSIGSLKYKAGKSDPIETIYMFIEGIRVLKLNRFSLLYLKTMQF